MKKILSFVVILAIASFAGSALAKDQDLSGYYSVQIEDDTREICMYGVCERFSTGGHITVVKPMFLADSQVRQLKAEGKLLESASSKPAKPEKIRRAKKAKAKVVKSAPKKRAKIAVQRKLGENGKYKVVRNKDTLGEVARSFRVKPEDIARANPDKIDIKKLGFIRAGWELKIPAPEKSENGLTAVLDALREQKELDEQVSLAASRDVAEEKVVELEDKLERAEMEMGALEEDLEAANSKISKLEEELAKAFAPPAPAPGASPAPAAPVPSTPPSVSNAPAVNVGPMVSC